MSIATSAAKSRKTWSDIGEGTGTEVYRRVKRYRIPEPPANCPCISIAIQMNEHGPTWCEEHQKDISRQIAYNATNLAALWTLRHVIGPVLRVTAVPVLSLLARFILVRPAIHTVKNRTIRDIDRAELQADHSQDQDPNRLILAVASKD